MNKSIKYALGILCSLAFLVASAKPDERVKITVAQDGSGDFTTIQEAINTCRAFQMYDKVIFIKNGIYKEKVLIDAFFTHLHLIGESKDKTIITYDDYAGKGNIGTFTSYTVKVLGDHTTIENLTIENSSGEVGQAVALHVEGDCVIVKNCRILGNQDTLYAAGQKSRQYYSNCYIDGTTDFIFGAATAVFENCTLHSKRNSYITAASTPESNTFGYIFRHCKLTAEPEVTKVYLGRPWRDDAKVVYIECEMENHIVPEGWHNWSNPQREKTAFYAEFNNKGPGANPSKRVSWSHQLTKKELKNYTFDKIFSHCSKWAIQPESHLSY